MRKDLFTGEPILFAPDRAQRPRAFEGDPAVERCPFCPGHEADTPPEIARIGSLQGEWRVRVFPNKYPAVAGAEVIVEAPEHHERFELVGHGQDVVRTYIDRYRAHGDAACVSIFKNAGAGAGSSIGHLHSQLVPLPFVPPRVARELASFASSCPLCAPVGPELVIRETGHFLWFAPYGSRMPYQQCIAPRRHVVDITELTEGEIADLASLLRSAARAMIGISDAYNWLLMNFPRGSAGHAYVELFPRLTTIAGLEWATGTFVEIIDPAAAAERLRQ